jgi:hypothetical protein
LRACGYQLVFLSAAIEQMAFESLRTLDPKVAAQSNQSFGIALGCAGMFGCLLALFISAALTFLIWRFVLKRSWN